MTVKKADELEEMAAAVLVAAGASTDNAAIVADHLVSANLAGVDTHGVRHLPGYVNDLAAGFIDGKAGPETLRSSSTSLLVTGHWTFGHVAARYATEEAIVQAREIGVSIAGVVQAHHIGRLGYYTEMATANGLVAQVWAGGYSEESPVAVPFGGRKRLLHTNPVSMGFPSEPGTPVMFDFATTAMSGVKIEDARRLGKSLPPGSIVDRAGNYSTNPQDFFDGGAHATFGGHKGYALNVAAEYYGRVLTGSNAYADPKRGGPIMRNQGVTILLVRDDVFTSSEEFETRAVEMAKRTRAIPPAPGFESVQVPGDPESRTRRKRMAEGIPIEDEIWEQLESLPR
ncbi:MAG TPA: Ldh family oxidoreductase [Candidatus Dormibacteraeota bacterium]